MIERDDAALALGQSRVAKVYDGLIEKGRLSEEGKAAILTALQRFDRL